jgi:hypothetical protein
MKAKHNKLKKRIIKTLNIFLKISFNLREYYEFNINLVELLYQKYYQNMNFEF